MQIIEDNTEKRAAIEKIAVKYAPETSGASRDNVINSEWNSLCILRMDIEHMTGKEAVELAKKKHLQ